MHDAVVSSLGVTELNDEVCSLLARSSLVRRLDPVGRHDIILVPFVLSFEVS